MANIKTQEATKPEISGKKIGIVTSDKMDKTRVVSIVELRRHPIYGKSYKFTSKIKAHDEKNEFHAGDEVEIAQTKPISKEKAWKIVRKVK